MIPVHIDEVQLLFKYKRENPELFCMHAEASVMWNIDIFGQNETCWNLYLLGMYLIINCYR